MSHRKIQWISSSKGNPEKVALLAQKMDAFYGEFEQRDSYQELLNSSEGLQVDQNDPAHHLTNYINSVSQTGHQLLEIGCGGGNLFKLLAPELQASYTGIEMAEYVIAANRKKYPMAQWKTGSAYQIPFADQHMDLVYSYYVIEHFVYVEQGLKEMLRVLKPGGKLALIFPDFVAMKRMSSQFLGLSARLATAKDKIRNGKILDGVLSLYDSKVKVPKYIEQIDHNNMPFPVNLNPICLIDGRAVRPDYDAIYVASKEEIAAWAKGLGHQVEFPQGKDGFYHHQAFIVITKK